MPLPSNASGLPTEIQAAYEEAERCIAETNAAFIKVRELESKVEQLAREYPDQVTKLGINVARLAYNQSGSLAVGLEYGLIAAGAAAVYGAASWLHGVWKKMKCSWILDEILSEKQDLARKKRQVIARLRPTLGATLSTIERGLKNEAGLVLPPSQYQAGTQALGGIKRLFPMYVRTSWCIQVADYIHGEMGAWLAGKQQSNLSHPSEAVPYLDAVQLVCSAGPAWEGKSTLIDRTTIGKVFLLRDDALGKLQGISGSSASRADQVGSSLRQVARALAWRRIASWLLPFGTSARTFRAFNRAFLSGCGSLAIRTAWGIILILILPIFAIAGGLSFSRATPITTPPLIAAPQALVPRGAAAPREIALVGEKGIQVFHKVDCKLVTKIKVSQKVPIATRVEANKAGHKPCKVCKP